jgi:methylmalonyl-CoA/ethylmalonyl-CoA epimerase
MSVKWMFHATALAQSYDALLSPLERLLGCRVLHLNSSDVPGLQRRGGMTWLADNSIELGEPYGQSPSIQRFLDRFGGGMHSIAVQVDDLDRALEHAGSVGVRVADRVLPQIAFTRPTDTAGLLFEWSAVAQLDDPRWGAVVPAAPTSVLEPTAFSYVAAVVDDPFETAAMLAGLFQTQWSPLDARGRNDAPWSAVSLGDCSLALFPLRADGADSLWGAQSRRPRFISMAVTVASLEQAERDLLARGYSISARLADDSLVLYGQGIGFPLIIGADLLAADPRRSRQPSEGNR